MPKAEIATKPNPNFPYIIVSYDTDLPGTPSITKTVSENELAKIRQELAGTPRKITGIIYLKYEPNKR